jgi:RNA polymerase-binding transcription factor DksA
MDTATYKTHLEALKDTLITDLSVIALHRQDIDQWELKTEAATDDTADPTDYADIAEDSEERLAIFTQLSTRYHNVVRALAKIEAGNYGICEISGHPIEPARLAANPAARTCVAHREDEATLPL